MQLKVGKSPGIDGIPAEVYHHGGDAVLYKLLDVFTNFGEKGTLGVQSMSLCAKTREKSKTGQTTEASPYSLLRAKSWFACVKCF